MVDYFDEDLNVTEDFREAVPEWLGDDYYNDPKTKQQPTKELDNVKTLPDLIKRVVHGSRKISAHGDELKKATEGMIKIPGEGATEEEINAYRKASGVPDSPDGYDLKIPDQDKEGFEAIAKEVREAAYQAGISPSKLSGIWDKVTASLVAQMQAMERKGMELLAEDIKALKEAKKEKYDSFISDTNRVAYHFDIKSRPEEGIEENLIGSNFMKLMDTLGVKDTPVVRNFLAAIAPLVFEGKTKIGAGVNQTGGEGWFTDYDETGKEV